ncbi:F-box/LRR-repeat protein 13-like [Gossypium australe]|uniref:F-box/LRR-repeat protein 13-like n=1 Tax=Gossypium australe TaxID=47621 RepID=A0A5B6VPU0_9ROSI|nr:F-box/LRR-repeat protein 13-like [Gossypium australe]
MLRKFISVSETWFQNTEATLKNQQASIHGLENQIGQLVKLVSERPQEDKKEQKPVVREYKPQVPYPNALKRDQANE